MSRQFPSEVIAETIDADYPVAGQDNDSQGFRDNFSVIKDGLATAKAELTDLQTNSARLDDNNNFGGYLVDNATTNRLYGTVYTTTDVGSINVDLANGPYQEITVTGTATLIIDGWPTEDVYASMKLAIKSSTATAYQVTLSAAGGSNKVFNSLPASGIVTVDDDLQLIDVWTIDQGATVYFKLDASPTISVIDNLTDVTIASPTNGQVLKYNGTAWINAADALGDSLTLDNLTDVVITGTPADGQVLKYDTATSKWINAADALGDSLTIDNLTDVVITGTPTNGQVLKYDTATSKWINAADALGDSLTLDNLTDVVITGTPTNGEFLTYSTGTSNWVNTAVTIPTAYYTGSEDLGNAGAADLTKSVSYFSTAGLAETATLAAGTDGQVKTFAADAITGNMVITVTNPAWGGAGTITFSAVGQSCILQYINSKWFCVGNNGAAFA
jgi:hypothetical protein